MCSDIFVYSIDLLWIQGVFVVVVVAAAAAAAVAAVVVDVV